MGGLPDLLCTVMESTFHMVIKSIILLTNIEDILKTFFTYLLHPFIKICSTRALMVMQLMGEFGRKGVVAVMHITLNITFVQVSGKLYCMSLSTSVLLVVCSTTWNQYLTCLLFCGAEAMYK